MGGQQQQQAVAAGGAGGAGGARQGPAAAAAASLYLFPLPPEYERSLHKKLGMMADLRHKFKQVGWGGAGRRAGGGAGAEEGVVQGRAGGIGGQGGVREDLGHLLHVCGCAMPCHIMPCHITSHHIMPRHVTS